MYVRIIAIFGQFRPTQLSDQSGLFHLKFAQHPNNIDVTVSVLIPCLLSEI